MASITTVLAGDFLDQVNTACGSSAVLRVYGNASAPTDADAPVAGTELVDLPLSTTAFGTTDVSNTGGPATITANTITSGTATASHDPTYARIIADPSGTPTVVMQFTCHVSGSGSGDITFGSSIVSGATVSVTSLTVNMPNEV